MSEPLHQAVLSTQAVIAAEVAIIQNPRGDLLTDGCPRHQLSCPSQIKAYA